MSYLKTFPPRAAIARAVAQQSPPTIAQIDAWRRSKLPLTYWWHMAVVALLALCATVGAPAAWLLLDAGPIMGNWLLSAFFTLAIAVVGGLASAQMFFNIRNLRDEWRSQQRDLAWLSDYPFVVDLAFLGHALDHPHNHRYKAC